MQNPLTPMGWKFAAGVALAAGAIGAPFGLPWSIAFAIGGVGLFMFYAWGMGY